MREAIESAPKDGKVVIVRDGENLAFDPAHWSGPWVGGKPPVWPGPAETPAGSGARQMPLAKSNASRKSAQGRQPPRRRRYMSLLGGVATVSLLLILATRDAGRPDPVEIREQVMARATLPPTSAPAIAPAMLRQGNPGPEAQRSLEGEQAGAGAQELAEARRTIGILNAQLQAEATKTEQSLSQERSKAAALMREAAAVRQELAASTAQHRQALDEERAQRTALAVELMAAQRDFEAQAAQLRKASDEIGQLKQAETSRTGQPLEEERQKTATLVQEAAAARQELAASAAQHRQVLDQERGQRAVLAAELSTAQREVAAQGAQLRKVSDETGQLRQAEAAKTAQSLEQERQKTAALAQAAAARQALSLNVAQYRQALDDERVQRTALVVELAAARRDVEAQAAQLRKASDEAGQLRQAEAAKAEQALELERQKTTALAQQAAAVRQALTASMVQNRQALDDERKQRTALAAELSAAQREVAAQSAQLRKANGETDQVRQATETMIAEARQALQQERDRSAAIAEELASVRALSTRPAPAEQKPVQAAIVATPQLVGAEIQSSPDAARLIARASALLGQGDIGSARIVLERAVETGSARASFMLAETYDPRILSAWGTYGTRGEVTRARELYARAQVGGIREAKDRVDALPQ
ncbi:hypothetical protein LJR090_005234 [Bosea sp. LjRoot90]|uniref:hypothetical protein n=1 Tax=Bosea sp. LjRoot90 TaxID=3342342 RepID=UPI003ECC91BF